MKNRPFFLLSLAALIATIWVAVCMERHTKAAEMIAPHGYIKPIIALEFAQDSTLVAKVFGQSATVTHTLEERIERIQKATNLDYLFLLVYGSFLFFFAVQCRRIWAPGTGWAMTFALIAAIADAAENICLKLIFSEVPKVAPDFSGLFLPLHVFTCLKFFSLGAFFIALAPFFWKHHWPGKLVVLAGSAALICWALAVFNIPMYWADALFGCILLAFLGLMIFGLSYRRALETDL